MCVSVSVQGGFAKCYWATCLETGEAFALKIVQKSSLVKSKARQKVSEQQASAACLVSLAVKESM